ncbi:hypothetical protein Hanom_Chr01g00054351 [Helianthus anomalus]
MTTIIFRLCVVVRYVVWSFFRHVTSTQKDQVVSTWTPHQEADISLESLFLSPSLRAMSLSTPQPSTSFPPTFLSLFDAIETQIQFSPFHSPVQESTLPHDSTPLSFQETLGGSSSEAATTTSEPIGFQLDDGYKYKSSLKATTVEGTIVTSVPVGSPEYQDKRVFASTNLEISPVKEPNTTTSGRDSDYPIKLGDELRYKAPTERMSSMESLMVELKDMMKQMMEHSKSQPSTQ